MQDRLWKITEYPFEPEKQHYYETIFAIGNGYLGTRASLEEGYPGDMPVTLIHGIFNHSPEMSVPELVNAPNWCEIKISIDGTPLRMDAYDEDLLNPPQGALLGYRRELLIRRGLLRREVLFRAVSGSTVRIVFERFASLDDQHAMAQRVYITLVDGDEAEITLEAAIDGDVTNNGIRHWIDCDSRLLDDVNGVGLRCVTQQSSYEVGMASVLISPAQIVAQADGIRPNLTTTLTLNRGETTTVDKLTAIYTSRDTDEPLKAAYTKVSDARTAGYDALMLAHEAAWARHWENSDVVIEGDDWAQTALRFSIYHLLVAAPQHDDDVSIGAKTLSGLGYKGHVFWDTELFILPLLTLTQPKIARNLLMYRYKRLDGARRKAREIGCEGALFPWESTDTGEETTPQWSDPQPDGSRIRIWTGDSEQHIGTDIAYAILAYWRWTGDDEFLCKYGAEMVLDTAIFWESRVELKGARYEISRQIGPDEYHENIDNSVFTNSMVVWHLQEALTLLDWLKTHASDDADRLRNDLNITTNKLNKWQDIIDKMYIPFDEEKQHHIQFDGFFDMEYIHVPDYEPRVGGVWPMLGHERALQSQVIKQADVVMLMALLGDKVGSHQVMLNNFNTYYPRTDHGSSLSPAVHAWVAARLGLIDTAYYMFDSAAGIDLMNNKGNVRDGIHGASAGGLWQSVVFGFCGLHLTENGPVLDAVLPSHWRHVSFNVYYRGEKRRFDVQNPV